jgi:uncharacterized phage protein (TIGR01671 family)
MRDYKFRYVVEAERSNGSKSIVMLYYTLDDIEDKDIESVVGDDIQPDCDGNATCSVNGFCECGAEFDDWKIVARCEFTGLKEKNGKEIYEGDVIKQISKLGDYEGENIGIVEYNNKRAAFITKTISSTHDDKVTKMKSGTLDGEWLSQSGYKYSFEVIGNIYENPELLNNPE